MANLFGSWSFPLSGDVTQAINPWSWWANSMSQTGFINVNQVQSSNPKLEKEIIENVASYGKQLGRMIEALEVVLSRTIDETRLSDADRKALRDFEDMAAEIAAVKAGYYAPTEQNLDKLVTGMRMLKQRDPDRHAKVIEQLKTELFSER